MNPRAELERLTRELQDALGSDLAGLYAHGSLALGCFNPAVSDLDVLVVSERPLTTRQRGRLVHGLSRCERVEADVVAASSLVPWRYPTPYEAHFRFGAEPMLGPGESHDLAAHVTVARQTGIAVVGPPAETVFPEVPWEDLEDSLRRDLAWSTDGGTELYAVLSPARIWATLSERKLHSKRSGAGWALERAPSEFRPLIERALATYRGESDETDFDRGDARRFAGFVASKLGPPNLTPSP